MVCISDSGHRPHGSLGSGCYSPLWHGPVAAFPPSWTSNCSGMHGGLASFTLGTTRTFHILGGASAVQPGSWCPRLLLSDFFARIRVGLFLYRLFPTSPHLLLSNFYARTRVALFWCRLFPTNPIFIYACSGVTNPMAPLPMSRQSQGSPIFGAHFSDTQPVVLFATVFIVRVLLCLVCCNLVVFYQSGHQW